MNRKLVKALSWSGSKTVLPLFALFPHSDDVDPVPQGEHRRPSNVLTYELEDTLQFTNGRTCREYDLEYPRIGSISTLQIEDISKSWLDAMMGAGADVAWFGFEDSFSFDLMLDPRMATGIWAISTPEKRLLALRDKHRRSSEWAAQIGAIRHSLRLKDSSQRVELSTTDRDQVISRGLPFTVSSASSGRRDLTIASASPRTIFDAASRWTFRGLNQECDSETASDEIRELATRSMVGETVIGVCETRGQPEVVVSFASGSVLEIDRAPDPWALSMADAPVVLFGESSGE